MEKNINVWIDPWIPNNNGFIPNIIRGHTKIGNYEVKSSYYIVKDLIGKTLKNLKSQVSCHSFPKSFWYFSWKLGDKHKHKFFLRKCYPY